MLAPLTVNVVESPEQRVAETGVKVNVGGVLTVTVVINGVAVHVPNVPVIV